MTDPFIGTAHKHMRQAQGVLLQNGEGSMISNNIIFIDSSWKGMPISVEGFKSIQIGPNLVYANKPDIIKHDNLEESQENITVADPGFVSPPINSEMLTGFDFQLKGKDSPAVGRATAPIPCEDFKRLPRGTTATLGALEFFSDPAETRDADDKDVAQNCYNMHVGNSTEVGADAQGVTSSGGVEQTNVTQKEPVTIASDAKVGLPPTDITYMLEVGEWSACSKDCSGGMQLRTMTCMSSKNQSAPLSKCGEAKKSTFQKCNNVPCPKSVYEYLPWSACSQPCGGGTQVRKVTCLVDGATADAASCASLKVQELERPCNRSPCKKPTYWTETVWGACSKKCGGVQIRPEPTCKCAHSQPLSHRDKFTIAAQITFKPL
jgi:hypothetical protein